MQRLLLEEAGLTYQDLVYMMRWGAYAPRVAEIASINVTARKKGSLARDNANTTVGDPQPTTRSEPLPLRQHKGIVFCPHCIGCCDHIIEYCRNEVG